MTPQEPHPHLLYLDKSTPDEFINAELMDWIYLIGDISTQYELDFIRQFGHAMKATHTPAHPAQQRIDAEQNVIDAAMNWWMMQRPLNFSEEQHMKTPTVNCVGNQERALAKAIALLREGERG